MSAGEEATAHRHDDHQLIYASSGVLELFVPHGTWYTPSVRAVWVPAGTVHQWQTHGATTVHSVGIAEDLAPTLSDGPALIHVQPLLRQLIIACAENGAACTPAGRRLLQVLVDHVEFSSEPPTMLPSIEDQRLRAVKKILESDMTASPSLAELGREVGSSERTLSRLFSEELGMSYQLWRTQLRLHQALLLLAQGYSVTRAAAEVGYSSASAFITSFRGAFGRTPGSIYRRNPKL